MIGEKKLVPAKGRTESLFPQGGGVALDQGVQDGRRRCRGRALRRPWAGPNGRGAQGRGREPVAFAGKWIGRQADPAWEIFLIKMLPCYLESLDPPLHELLIFFSLDPFADYFLAFFFGFQECQEAFLLSHSSPIPVSSLLRLLEIFAQHLP